MTGPQAVSDVADQTDLNGVDPGVAAPLRLAKGLRSQYTPKRSSGHFGAKQVMLIHADPLHTAWHTAWHVRTTDSRRPPWFPCFSRPTELLGSGLRPFGSESHAAPEAPIGFPDPPAAYFLRSSVMSCGGVARSRTEVGP